MQLDKTYETYYCEVEPASANCKGLRSIINLFDGTFTSEGFPAICDNCTDRFANASAKIVKAFNTTELTFFLRDVLGDAYNEDTGKTTVVRSIFKVGIAPTGNDRLAAVTPFKPTGTHEEKKKLYFSKVFIPYANNLYANSSELGLGFKVTFTSPTLKDMEYISAVRKDYFLVIGSGSVALVILFVKTFYLLTSFAVLLQSMATYLASYMIFIEWFGLENLSMLHILSFFYVVSASTNQFFHQFATWQVIYLLDLKPRDKMATFMKTGASSLLFSMLCRICGFSTMVFLKSAILRFLAFKNIISIIIAFLLSILYITPTLLLNIMYGADKVIFCCKCAKMNFLKKRPISKFFANTYFKIVSNTLFAFSIIVLSIIISCAAVFLFAIFDFNEVKASQVNIIMLFT